MICWLFCIISLYDLPCKIDINHNEIYLCTVSPLWSCGMMVALCVNDHESESHQGQF